MKWINTKDQLPPMVDDFLLNSDLVLCQDRTRHTFLGYVSYPFDDEWPPDWLEEGRNMDGLPEIVRWIYLKDVLSQIA